MMQDGPQALRDYRATGSEAAFRQLVACYVDLVYTAAVRLVNGDTHLAEDVTQQVFIDLARLARGLAKEVMLGGWLHRHTCFVAANVLRGDRRRRERERQAVEMNAQTDHSDANLAAVAPALDEAINQLPADDRAAIMLRFFEQRDFRAVGESLGSNEEAARKRVSRALDKLRSLLKRRGVEISAASLAATLGTGAVSAAPAGLAVTVSSAALAASVAAATTASTLTVSTLIVMTKLKAGIITAIVATSIAIPFWMEHRALEMSRQENAAENARNRALSAENEDLHRQLAKLTNRAPVVANNSSEVLKLRGEVSQLRQLTSTNTPPTGPSALSGVTANPEMRKMLRDQQKAGLSAVYKGFGKVANLSTNQVAKLNDLLADNVMENVDHIQAILREGKSPEQASALFASQEAALQDKVKELLGPEGFAQYQDYTKNLLSTVTAEQFKGMLTGDKETKEAQASKLNQLLQQESQAALAAAGLPPDYQLVPTLNFRNFAYASEMEKNLQLLGNIYDRAAAQAGSFLSQAELEKFAEFRTMAINGNRMGLELNRKMMAPGGR